MVIIKVDCDNLFRLHIIEIVQIWDHLPCQMYHKVWYKCWYLFIILKSTGFFISIYGKHFYHSLIVICASGQYKFTSVYRVTKWELTRVKMLFRQKYCKLQYVNIGIISRYWWRRNWCYEQNTDGSWKDLCCGAGHCSCDGIYVGPLFYGRGCRCKYDEPVQSSNIDKKNIIKIE